MTDASQSCWKFIHSKRCIEYNYPRVTHRFHSLLDLSLVMHGEEELEEGGCCGMKIIRPPKSQYMHDNKEIHNKQTNKTENVKLRVIKVFCLLG